MKTFLLFGEALIFCFSSLTLIWPLIKICDLIGRSDLSNQMAINLMCYANRLEEKAKKLDKE